MHPAVGELVRHSFAATPLVQTLGERFGQLGVEYVDHPALPARGPLRDKNVVKNSKQFIPVFIDTLKDIKTTKRFKERYGSFPVLRVHDLKGRDIGGRIDGNRVAGKIPVKKMLQQFKTSWDAFKKALKKKEY